MKTNLRFLAKKQVVVPSGISFLVFLFYLGFLNYLEPAEIGIARNWITGEMWIQDDPGLYISPPWVWVSCIDTRPVRVAVTSAGRGYSAKLVKFNKDSWREFVELEGWHFYWLYNRLSFNGGYDEEYRGMRDILRGYTYSPKKYPFLVVLEEYHVK